MKPPKTDLSALNEPQREAVTSEEKRLLVLAGAGSGKTKTLLQKIIYLIEEKGVNPSEILAITFTKNSSNEMIDRLIISSDTDGKYERMLSDRYIPWKEKETQRYLYKKKFGWIDNITLSTFHSLCYKILRTYGVNQFDNKFKILGDTKKNEDDEWNSYTAPETVAEIIHKVTIELCEDRDFLLLMKRYILDYLVDKIHQEVAFAEMPEDGKFYTTLNGDKVRSKSEQFIADWLLRHNIPYQYEPWVNVKDFYFKPDFYIPAANLYIEHISEKSFPTEDKEEQLRKGDMHYVKTYESMARDSSLFSHALDRIVKNRLPHDFHQTITVNYIEAFNGYHDHVRDFLRDVIRVMDMMKVENVDFRALLQKAQQDQHERIRSFYELAIPIIERYSQYCTNKSYLDFNDLISQAIALFGNHADITQVFRDKYKYILVDEFQDVNNLQVELLQLLLTPETQLFCVGDDWQSIYGFRGSNVGYIVEFGKYFKNAHTIKLDINYRSSEHIVGASNEVIKHNKFKVEKNIKASKRSEQKIVVFAGQDKNDNHAFILKQIKELLNDGIERDEILFLYRRSKMFFDINQKLRNAGLNIPGKTIHASKGLEARIVFLLGLTDGSGGFPDVWLEDRIFQVIKPANHDLLMEEERRLFYVAITRAKEKLYLVTEKSKESRFLKEIPEKFTVKTATTLKPVFEKKELCISCGSELERLWKLCPYCGTSIDFSER